MGPSDLFAPEDLLLGFDPADKWEAIHGLVDHLVERGRIDAASSNWTAGLDTLAHRGGRGAHAT